ncbi:Phosphatidylserine decarboxylase proenzyme [gamma proteobacterium HdN1]|nr:Phosphatidylserine decarboxylase proenzyme [gamma proteobacterium HdN1]
MEQQPLDRLRVLPQYILPHHLLSRSAGLLAECQWPLVKDALIRSFTSAFPVNMSEAQQENPFAYASFNDFFTRALKPDARPIAETGIVCPADGAISQLGKIDDELIFQAKGHSYTLTQLLGGDTQRAEPFRNGEFATVYLSPRDYHRVHMPYAGRLTEMIYVPGKLFSVNQRTSEHVPALFARNERVVAIFETDLGPMAVVLVGAMIVASIETVWAGLVTPPKRKLHLTRYTGEHAKISLARGEEMGRFKLGSTAIILFPKGQIRWDESLRAGTPVRMGQAFASCIDGA